MHAEPDEPLLVDHASSYLRLASKRPDLQGKRNFMVKCYLEDVDALRERDLPPTAHIPVGEQKGSDLVVRFVNWNVNVLMGPDSYSSVEPESVAAILSSLNADVVVMQESPVQWKDASWESDFAQRGRGDELSRIQELDRLLAGMGYQLLRSPADNPTLLASRLPLRRMERGPMLDAAPIKFISQYGGGEAWMEERAACYAELLLPGSRSCAVYATHLHHLDRCAAAGEGVRQREVLKLLEHFSCQRAPPPVTVLLADFNQPRKLDYTAQEWEVISAGRRHIGEPEDDGVAGLLSANGFSCVFDSRPVSSNFGSRYTPAFTHWTGTMVDYMYVHDVTPPSVEVAGAFVCHTTLSDHLPLVVDLRFFGDSMIDDHC